MPTTTIVTAAHLDNPDKARWLKDLGDNLLAQDFEDWEWIVVDDASPIPPDPPPDVRIRVVRAARQVGPALCRNTGVALARTDSVMVIDADDMLASEDTLGRMHQGWLENPDHFVYGHMQWLGADGNRQRVVKFKEYTFQASLNLSGVVPVTAMMSVECWAKAGGWKAEFEAGLEDVEFWICAGAAGFCGLRLDEVTLLYRRHPHQRTQRMRAAVREQSMRSLIRERHADLFEGRYPMGCCGGGRTRPLAAAQRPRAGVVAPRMLADDPTIAGGKIWVRYEGMAQAEFRVNGSVTRTQYVIPKRGALFQVWAQDAAYFQNAGRGKQYSVGVAPPEEPKPEPEEEQAAPTEPTFQAPEPELATIERLDPVGQATRGEPEPAGQESEAELVPLDGLESLTPQQKEMLSLEGWHLERLAAAEVDELVPYPSIGKVTAANAISEANRLQPT